VSPPPREIRARGAIIRVRSYDPRMAKFNIHEPIVQAAIIEAAARLSAVRKVSAEETAALATELLTILAKKPEETPYATLPPSA
jgi:hypothetical protein